MWFNKWKMQPISVLLYFTILVSWLHFQTQHIVHSKANNLVTWYDLNLYFWYIHILHVQPHHKMNASMMVSPTTKHFKYVIMTFHLLQTSSTGHADLLNHVEQRMYTIHFHICSLGQYILCHSSNTEPPCNSKTLYSVNGIKTACSEYIANQYSFRYNSGSPYITLQFQIQRH